MKIIPIIVEEDCSYSIQDLQYIYKLCGIMCEKYEVQFLKLIEGEFHKGFIVYNNPEIIEKVIKSVNNALSLKKSDYIVMLPKTLNPGKGFVFYPKGNIVISK